MEFRILKCHQHAKVMRSIVRKDRQNDEHPAPAGAIAEETVSIAPAKRCPQNAGLHLAISLKRPTQVQPKARALCIFLKTRFPDFRTVDTWKSLNFWVGVGRTSSIRCRNFQQNRYGLRPQIGAPQIPVMPLAIALYISARAGFEPPTFRSGV